MGEAYFDRASVQRRLNNTICMWKGSPVYITTEAPRRLTDGDAFTRAALRLAALEGRTPPPTPETVPTANVPQGDHIVVAYDIPVDFGKPMYLDYTHPDFSYKSFPLGYMNFGNGAYYLYRIPSRQQSQGLEQHFIRYLPEDAAVGSWYLSASMKDCILGKYPTIAEARDQINNYAVHSMAFCRDTALSRLAPGCLGLMYRGRKIGYSDGMSDKFRLFPSKETKALRIALEGRVEIA